jgi:hypothetical protein
MVTTRRYILLSLLQIFDLALLVGSFIAAAVPSLSEVGATSLTDFLSMRMSVRNFVLFSGLLLLWHSLFSFFGLYKSKRFSSQRREAIDISKAIRQVRTSQNGGAISASTSSINGVSVRSL